jgi:hypothetical protein
MLFRYLYLYLLKLNFDFERCIGRRDRAIHSHLAADHCGVILYPCFRVVAPLFYPAPSSLQRKSLCVDIVALSMREEKGKIHGITSPGVHTIGKTISTMDSFSWKQMPMLARSACFTSMHLAYSILYDKPSDRGFSVDFILVFDRYGKTWASF